MATRKEVCINDCRNKHSSYEITMAEIRKDLTYIKEKLDSNTEMIKEVIENKADRTEVEELREAIFKEEKNSISFKEKVLYTTIGVLFAIVGFMIKHYIIK